MTTFIDTLAQVQINPTKFDQREDQTENLKKLKEEYQNFQDFLNDYDLDLEYFKIYPYDRVKYTQLITGGGKLVFQVIDDLGNQELTQNKKWDRNHYFMKFDTLDLKLECPETLTHNFTPFNIHLQDLGFYLETWSPKTMIEYILGSLGIRDFIFLPVYQNNHKQENLHVSLIIIHLSKLEIYHWDPNGSWSVFWNRDDPRRDIIPGLMEMTLSHYFELLEFKQAGLSFKYIPNSEIPLYNFNTPIEKYDYDKGDCFIHLLLVPYLITKLKSLDKVVEFYKKMNKRHQSFLIYNYSSYLVQKYPNLISPKNDILAKLKKEDSKTPNDLDSLSDFNQMMKMFFSSTSTKKVIPEQLSNNLSDIIQNLKKIINDIQTDCPGKEIPVLKYAYDLDDEVTKLEKFKTDLENLNQN